MSSPVQLSSGAALEYVGRRFGGPVETVKNPLGDALTVGLAATRIAPFDPERVQLTLINLSVNEMFVLPGSDVSTTKGIRIGPNGGGVSFNVDQDGWLPCEEYHAVATAAGSAVLVVGCKRTTRFRT